MRLTLSVHAQSVLITAVVLAFGTCASALALSLPENCDGLQRQLVRLRNISKSEE